MLRWPDYFVDPPSDTTSGDVNLCLSGDLGIRHSLIRQERASELGFLSVATDRFVGLPTVSPLAVRFWSRVHQDL